MQGIDTISIAIHAFSNQSEQQDFCELNGLLTFHGAHTSGPHCEGQRGQREPRAGCSVIGNAAVRSGRGDKDTLWQRAASESVRQQSSHVSPHQTTRTQMWPWCIFDSSTKVYCCCTFRFFVQQMMKPHLLDTFYLTFKVDPTYRIYMLLTECSKPRAWLSACVLPTCLYTSTLWYKAPAHSGSVSSALL